MDTSSSPQASNPVDFDLDLPPLPQTMVATAGLTPDDEVDDRIAELKRLVSADPIVTAKTLRRVNSVYYGLQRRVGNVEQAVVLLGFQEVHKLITTAGMITLEEVFNSDRQRAIFDRIIRRSVATASYANVLSQELCLNCAHLSYTGGLLHAIGRVVLLYNDPTVYEKLWWNRGYPEQPKVRKERAIYRLTYAEVGAQATQKWDLPDTVALAIQHHLDPPRMDNDRALETLTLAICASRGWANKLMRKHNPKIPAEGSASVAVRALKRLAFLQNRSHETLENFMRENEEDVEEFMTMVMPQNAE
jgi:HD-like signal output (HDOD) protein